MAIKTDPCKDGLTPECFATAPAWAKMAFAYRLLCALAPPEITRRLQKYLLDAIFAAGFDIPPDFMMPPGVIFPPGWTPGDPLPPGFEFPPGFDFPPGWQPGDPVPWQLFFPPGTVFPPGFELPPGWQPGDPWPPGYPLPPGVPPPPGDTGPNPPGFISPWEPGPTIVPGRNPPPGELITVKLFSSLSNGRVISRANNWPHARGGDDYLNAVSDEYSAGDAISAYFEGAQYYVNRTFLYFDLSSIPAGSKIKSAVLGVVGNTRNDSSVRVYKGTQEDPLVNTDFEAYEGYPFALATWQKYEAPDFNTNLMTLSSGARSYIQGVIGGTAKFCLREDTKDRANEAPTILAPLNGVNFSKWSDEDYKPSLTLIYR